MKQNGMAWGLDGLQLSDEVEAFGVDPGFDLWFIDDLLELIVESGIKVKPNYDFYNTEAEATACGMRNPAGKYFPYNGYQFCKKIITKANGKHPTKYILTN